MKKNVKRILYSALSLTMCSTLAVESVLRLSAEGVGSANKTTTASASFTEVTGQYDTSKLRESYFNDSVLKSEEVAPVYETRSVIVTLSGDDLVARADGALVSEYVDSFSGEVAKSDIRKEQAQFLQALKQKGISYKLEDSYDAVLNGVAIEVDTKYVSAIKEMRGVESVVVCKSYAVPQTVQTYSSGGVGQSTDDNVVHNTTSVYDTGIYNSAAFTQEYGAGTVVAVLDTGLDYTHAAFQSFQHAGAVKAWNRTTVGSALENNGLIAVERSGSLEISDVYMNDRVPFAYDYADDDPDVYPSYSNHGTHVAGIIGGYDQSGYTDKDGYPVDDPFLGVVPDAQLMICKVFTDDLDDPDLGGAVSKDIVAALNDCVKMGVDVINMSLGTTCGFTTTDDGDEEGLMLNEVYNSIKTAGISLICAASNDYSAGYGGVYGTNLASNPDSGTVGSPSTYSAALSVASINGQKAKYLLANSEKAETTSYVFFEESRDIDGNPYDFINDLQSRYGGKKSFEYVVVPGVGHAADYTSTVKNLLQDRAGNSLGRLALVKRGDSTFEEKVEIAMEMGAAGVIVYNNVAGMIRMNLGEIDNPVPSISISMNAGAALVENAKNRVGTFIVDENNVAGPFMSEFSSWGPSPDLKLKPEITAHGGEITSAVPGGYGEQSGTSMATPNMAGFMAIVRSYIKQDLGITDPVEINRLAMQLTMSTAGTVYDQDGLPYSPRKQGAGVARLENVVGGTGAYLYVNNEENDYRPKIELTADKEMKGVYTLTFRIKNFGATELKFTPNYEFMTETLSSDRLTVSEQAYMLDDIQAAWSVDGSSIEANEVITVAAGAEREITAELCLSEAEKKYIQTSFENGMYVEGFLKLTAKTSGQCDLSLPFLGFYGDWSAAPMLDYSAYEVAENAQDASVLEEDKIKASIWETQPYNIYYNDKYVLPMGGYLYLLPEGEEPMYVDEEHNAVSRYNEYYGEGAVENYMTTTGLKAVYAGLLRNARVVRYKLYDEATGEVLISDSINRVGKAYSGGGSAVPANVKLEIYPEEEGFIANGRYRMEFEFFQDTPSADEVAREEDTFGFSFTVDYEAPVMQNARVRYYNYKEGNKEKQRIYLDVDVYDNHYVQTMLLCYPKTSSDGDVSLQLATEYPTPVRNGVRNGVTTVSVEITDIYEEYGDQLYIQLDDYALNTCLYQVNINEANADMLPEGADFDVAEDTVNVDIYGTHKSAIIFGSEYEGEGDASNFLWTSANPQIANVKNGEIVGLRAGKTKIFVSNRKGGVRTIDVTVSNQVARTLPKVPSISFGVIQTDADALQKANGVVPVAAGKNIKLNINTEPWYHPMDPNELKIVWKSTNENVATVDQEGNVLTIKKGTAVISATVMQKAASGEWEATLYTATSIMQVQDEFTVSNYTLTKYSGLGYTTEDGFTVEDGVLKIPTDMNIMYIGEEAFKDNNNIKKIIIPESVVDIRRGAFYNCTALEEVYFVKMTERDYDNEPAKADVAMIYEEAFYGCTNLRLIDFSHTKTVTVAQDCFAGCKNLTTVIDMPSIGTMHHRAFAGTGLTSIDLSGLHMSGQQVFAGCMDLTTIANTSQFTAIGDYMFQGCLGLRNQVVLKTSKIGKGAFLDCVNLAGVKFDDDGKEVAFDIGARAFENCGTNLKGNFYVDFGDENTVIRSIGERAFAGSSLKTLGQIHGLEVLGENAFVNTQVTAFELNDTLKFNVVRLTGIPFDGLTVTVATGSTQYVDDGGVIYDGTSKKILYVNASVTGVLNVPDSVTAIGDYAFANGNVSKVVFGNASQLSSIGVGAFKGASLREIEFGGARIDTIAQSAFENSTLTSVTLPDSVVRVESRAFANTPISTLKADGLTYVGNNAFEGCGALKKVELSETVTTVGDRAFYNCTSLTEVKLPAVGSVKDSYMGAYVFYGAISLDTVTFGAKAKTTGTYTFAGTPVTKVVFEAQNAITTIGEGTFMECEKLEAITLPATVTVIEAHAFNGCKALATVTGIEGVESFGAQSFYNVGLPKLTLTAAQKIGYMAFAAFESADQTQPTVATYKTVSIPAVVEIEDFAFFNSGISSVNLPASLQKMGAAVFASSDKLESVTVDAGNELFFAEDDVLYRYTKKSSIESEYELVFYPTARVEEGRIGERTYTVKEGTVRVLAYAFYKLNKDVLSGVVLPYSINVIGDSAFLESGVTSYRFESIEAPILETTYRSEVREALRDQSTIAEYKGYYNTNFQTYLYHFTKYGGQVSTMKMVYPSNGKGYDNPVYTMYFGVRTPTEVALAEDDTRACITLVQYVLEEPSVVASWKSLEVNEANTNMIKEFAETLKTARLYYNNAMANAGQASYITEEVETKLLNVEKEFRAVKKAFGILSTISELRIAEDSSHKTSYIIGEEFDMRGLSVIIVYDDYSTEALDSAKLRLLTTGELSQYNKYVEVMYSGVKLRVPVTVKDNTPPPVVEPEPDLPQGGGSTSAPDEEKPIETPEEPFDFTPILLVAGGVVAAAAVVTLLVLLGKAVARKAAIRREKEAALRAFEEKYGELHVNVEANYYHVAPVENAPAKKGKKKKKESNDTDLDFILSDYMKAPVDVPEGGKVKTNIKINKK